MSNIQQLIEEGIRVERIKSNPTHLRRLPPGRVVRWYGFKFKAERKMNARLNSRAIVICGGCVQGTVAVKGPDGKKTSQRKEHVDCLGSGYRVNKRYGRPTSGS